MQPFKKRRRGGMVATFEPGEAHLIANLVGQVVELLRDRNSAGASDPDPLAVQLGMGGPSTPPEDPVLLRLLPDAYRNDVEDAGEYRRFTERSLTTVKVENAETVIRTLVDSGMVLATPQDDDDPVEVELDPAAVQAWLKSLTDVRLSLAVRLGIETDEDHLLVSNSEDEATVAMAEIYDWLGYVQESLVAALD